MDIIGIRTFTIIHMLGIHMHIIPLRQGTRTAGTGPTSVIIAIIIATIIEPEE